MYKNNGDNIVNVNANANVNVNNNKEIAIEPEVVPKENV
jgi:hypothetical protein